MKYRRLRLSLACSTYVQKVNTYKTDHFVGQQNKPQNILSSSFITMDSRIYQIAINYLDGIGPVYARRLIKRLGDPRPIFSEPLDHLLCLEEIPRTNLLNMQRTNALELARKELDNMEKHGVSNLFYQDEKFPHRLEYCNDAPTNLFAKGSINLNTNKVISIVGTRHSSAYGVQMVNQFIEEISSKDILIVSGMAFGIDISAHRAANRCGVNNTAVLAHGLDRVYPSQHVSEARRTLNNGGWLSEFPIGTAPDRENFPMRNRIVAGLADVTIIVESASTGGSLITAELAHAYNREVAAYPGRVIDKYSQGCNTLIRTQKAALIHNLSDLEKLMGWDLKNQNPERQIRLFDDLSTEEDLIMRCLQKKRMVAIDELSVNSGLSSGQVSHLLLQMEFKGIIRSHPGKLYATI
ncbi:MAG: DNA processing protein [Flavobacteriales bacterium]|jgi:DNA processing protein